MLLSSSILSLLSKQYYHETANALTYTMLQSWAEFHGLDGTASFFGKQAGDEHKHASMVLDYIHARNEKIAPGPVPEIKDAPDQFRASFELAQAIERATTDAVNAIKAQAELEADHATCVWLAMPGGLILEQVEEENTIQTIIDRITARAGGVSFDGSDVFPADLPGNIIHDIDCWLKAR